MFFAISLEKSVFLMKRDIFFVEMGQLSTLDIMENNFGSP